MTLCCNYNLFYYEVRLAWAKCVSAGAHSCAYTHCYKRFEELKHVFVLFFPLATYAAPFHLDFTSIHQPSSAITTNVCTVVVSSCSSEGAAAVLELPVTLEGHSGAPVRNYTEQTEALSFIYLFIYFFASFLHLLCFISFRGRLPGLLLWRRSLWLDQGQRRGPALGDHAWSFR